MNLSQHMDIQDYGYAQLMEESLIHSSSYLLQQHYSYILSFWSSWDAQGREI